jgi:hypothetical protein
VDTRLPFGLRLAPLLFSAAADALEWVVKQSGCDHIFHYIDDFVLLGPPGSAECERGLRCLQQTCANLGVLLAEDKTEGPATLLTVLGIEFDTQAMVLRLPSDKLQRLQSLLAEWHTRGSGRRGELESLVGILQHASKVVRHGRCFLRRLYDLLAQTQKFKKHFRVRLNSECQADLEWWVAFSQHWNGASILRPVRESCPDAHLWSDASGSWGCGRLAGPLAPSGVGSPSHHFCQHCTEGVLPNHNHRGDLGPAVERGHGLRPLRQRGGGGNCKQWERKGPAARPYAAGVVLRLCILRL